MFSIPVPPMTTFVTTINQAPAEYEQQLVAIPRGHARRIAREVVELPVAVGIPRVLEVSAAQALKLAAQARQNDAEVDVQLVNCKFRY
ncbi:hypothetical protein PHMEG_00028747 [Phytophthora megakarya]|uniref:Uncharacterized protein n=1 Tax=Phytophthora megakarya TaxID=4795 RepID=A0A225V5T8_9STRA|nr:hypothetical protein PHMEG_00028747 [Phytophthora megakarya]